MKQFPFLGDGESVIAVLGSEQLQQSLNGKQPETAYSVITNQRVHFGGRRFFQNYVGDWKDESRPSSIPLNDITSISYQRKPNPTKAIKTFIKLAIIAIVIAVLIDVILRPDYGGILLLGTGIALILSAVINIVVRIRSSKQVMLDITIGCEKIYLGTSWYPKNELDEYYNKLIQAVSVAHKQETIAINLDTGKTFGGEKILAEFGEEYRCQYMKDKKPDGGFSVLTPERVHISGLHQVKLLPGIWYKSRKLHTVDISSINKIFFQTLGNPFLTLIIGILSLPLLFCMIFSTAYVPPFVTVLFGAFIPTLPWLFSALFKKSRLIIESDSGTFSFWTYWYRKDEITQFQKILTKVIEDNKLLPRETDNRRTREISATEKEDTTVSIKDGANLLREYNQLLQDGIIDQAEFDRVKTEILSKRN